MSDGAYQSRSALRRTGGRNEPDTPYSTQTEDSSRKCSVNATSNGHGGPTKMESRAQLRRRASPSGAKSKTSSSIAQPSSKQLQSQSRPTQSKLTSKTLKRQRIDANDSDSSNSSSARPSAKRKSTSSKRRAFSLSPKVKEAQTNQYVWVLLDTQGRVCRTTASPSRSMERVWWPAQVIHGNPNHSTTLTLRLFGSPQQLGNTLSQSKPQEVVVNSPSADNLLSMLDSDDRLRFKEMPLIDGQSSPPANRKDSLQLSPRKKPKLDRIDLEVRWKTAVGLMMEAKECDSDDLPDAESAFAFVLPSSQPSGAKGDISSQEQQQRKDDDDDDDGTVSDNSDLGSIEQDDSLTIPGELIFARESKLSLYWPAKILSYIAPPKRGEKPKYRIMYLDGTENSIPRDWFYSSEESGFATCKLGVWQSSFEDVSNDKDDGKEPLGDTSYRPSPEPEATPPAVNQFIQLDIRQQFVYTKTVLCAILNDRYTPARTRHEGFIAGGDRRQTLSKQAGLRGIMDPKQVEQLQGLLLEWCLRDEKRGLALVDARPDEEPIRDRDELAVTREGSTTLDETASEPPATQLTSKSTSPVHTEELWTPSSPAPLPADSSSITTISPAESRASVEEPPANQAASQLRQNGSTAVPLRIEIQAPQLDDDFGGAMSDGSELTPIDGEEDGSFEDPLTPLRPPRQRGCEGYEALTANERLKYCSDVLLPEAVIQILLWRAGLRTSPELLNESEEQSLYKKGVDLARETDWVHDVMRLRESRTRTLTGKWKAMESQDSRSRLKRKTVSAVDYRE